MSSSLIKEALNTAEVIGVIGSPSSTSQINVDILESAITQRLIGNLGIFNFLQNNRDHYALSQFTEITMRNTWSEDPTIRGLIRQKGAIDPITERQDVHLAQMTVSSVFSENQNTLEPSILGTIPATGTSIRLMNENIMESLFHDYRKELFYLGNAYGSNIKMPMWFKHFGAGIRGANEAYHLGVFGKTGSGKSILSLMLMLAYARHESMCLFVFDPQGEFTKIIKKELKIQKLLKDDLDREVQFIDLHNLILSGWDLFTKILIYANFFKILGVHHETNQGQAADELIRILKRTEGNKKEVRPWEAYEEGVFENIWYNMQQDDVINRIYSSQDLRNRVRSSFNEEKKTELGILWTKVSNLFKYIQGTPQFKINDLVEEIDKKSKIVLIDLSTENIQDDILWNDTIKFIVIGELIKKLTVKAEEVYKKGNLLNTLVVVDEAHRLAPREKSPIEDLEILKARFIDGVRTTRKYGLGWMFISQTLSSLDKRIIEQIRIYLFGFGLSWGIERQALKEIIGGQDEALRLYQMFTDPQSSLGKQKYPFMTIGPISPLSFSGTPLFFNALDFPTEFLVTNFKS